MRITVLLTSEAAAAGAFPSMLEVVDARTRILADLPVMRVEEVDLDEAAGRVAARSLSAMRDNPPHNVSAMDGYAVRAKDALRPGASLLLHGESRAGSHAPQSLPPGGAMRIFTGAPLPPGADAILIQENAERRGTHIVVATPAIAGQHIRRRSCDFSAGDPCIAAGRMMTARDIGLLAAAGYERVPVRRRPRIGVLSTGDEIARGCVPRPGQIPDANRPALKAAIRAWGGTPVDLGIAADDPAAIARMARGDVADLLLVTGGASVGDHDHVRAALEGIGMRSGFWKIRMRPGKPLMFDEMFGCPVLGLPGNPVSTLVCALLFLRPALSVMMGAPAASPVFERARLEAPLPVTGDREDYLRTRLYVNGEGVLIAAPFPVQDSSMLSVMAAAGGLIRRHAGAPAVEEGAFVEVLRFDACTGY